MFKNNLDGISHNFDTCPVGRFRVIYMNILVLITNLKCYFLIKNSDARQYKFK